MQRPPSRPARSGFTLVELLVVIVILGILMALLLPAISGAVRSAKNATVTSEINMLAQALEDFKTRYGDYPPSRIVLNESIGFESYDTASTLRLNASSIPWISNPGAYRPYSSGTSYPNTSGAATDITFGQLAQRSVRYMRKFFPRAGTPSDAATTADNLEHFHDFNGNGTREAGYILLEGQECLAFFLGGLPSSSGTGMAGFAKDPVWPFKNDLATPNAYTSMSSSNRQPPMFEFKNERLIDDDGDGIPGYIDSLATAQDGRFFVYFRAYDSGYDPNDVNIPDSDNGLISRPFRSGSRLYVQSPAPNPYTLGDPVPLNSSGCPDEVGTGAGSNPRSTTYHKAQSFQIISAGGDRLYGVGGTYDPKAPGGTTLPFADVTCSNSVIAPTDIRADIRTRENDNLTNFATGPLQ